MKVIDNADATSPPLGHPTAARPWHAIWRRHLTRVFDGSMMYFFSPGNVAAPKSGKIEN